VSTARLTPCGPLARLVARLARVRYRVRQVVRGLRPHLSPADVAVARSLLSEREFLLFLHAAPRDQRHSMDLHDLLTREVPDASRDLLAAALLHDVGKGALATWHRVAFVLFEAGAPALGQRLEAERGARWRQALWRLRHHARLGAEVLAATGSSPRVIAIVAAHTAKPPPDDPEIEAFIRADDRV
jgi:hypothetical protein